MRNRLAIQTWLAWAAAASFAALSGRNPFLLVLLILTVITVREMCPPPRQVGAGWRALIGMALILSVFTVVFNALTARSGDVVLFTIPDSFPLIDGPITLNAVVFGVISAAAILCLVLIWSTAAAHTSWGALARIMPDRMTGAGVAGAAAINLIPQTASAVTEMREACAGRGMTSTRARSFAFLISPIIATGLDRSVQMSDVLAARGFGSVRTQQHAGQQARWVVGWTALLSGLMIGSYAMLSRIGWASAAGLILAVAGGVIIWSTRAVGVISRSQYREHLLALRDWIVIGAAFGATVSIVVIGFLDRTVLDYSPYPTLTAPKFSMVLLIPTLLLAAPAVVGLFVELTDRD